MATTPAQTKLISDGEFTEQLITSDSQKTVALKDLPNLDPIPPSERTLLQWKDINYFVPTDGKDPTRQEAEQTTNTRIQSTDLSLEFSMRSQHCTEQGELIVDVNPTNGLPYQRIEQKGKKRFKQVVTCSSGYVKPGEMVAILGPSGSGKTSLLNVIAQRQSLSGGSYICGQISINQRALVKDGDFGKIGAFVQQDDVLNETMCAQELLEFACKIRCGLKGEAMKTRVQSVIDKLGLGQCKDTLVGGWMRKGVSGGERKRISIGYELITNPSLLLLDEPTSGLDSSTSLRITKMIKREAQRGMAVLATIHQPSAELFSQFDKVILLSEGYTVFCGPPSEVQPFFSQWGFTLPTYANPADKLSAIASAPWRLMPEKRPTIVDFATKVKQKQKQYWNLEPAQLKEITQDLQSNFSEVGDQRQVNVFTQYCLIVGRGYLFVTRNPISIHFLVFLAIYNAFLWGSIYYHTADQPLSKNPSQFQADEAVITNILGLTFLTQLDMFINMSMGQVISIPQIYPVYKREVMNNMFSPTAFYFGKLTVALITTFWYPFILTLCSIWWYGLPTMGFVGFVQWWAVLTMTAFAGTAYGITVGAIVPDAIAAQSIAILGVVLFNMGAGFFANAASGANWFITFLSYVSPLNYGCELMMRRILEGRGPLAVNGVLDQFGYTRGDLVCSLALTGYFVGFSTIGWAIMMWRGKDTL